MIYSRRFEIGLNDVGKNNEITNTAILEILEDIAAYHSDSIGYGINTTNITKVTWFLLDWKLKVIKRPKYGNTLKVNTWARYTNKCYSYRDFEIFNEEGELCSIATSKWLLINTEKGRITKIEDGLIKKYEPEETKSVFNILELDKLKEPDLNLYQLDYTYKVKRLDIDVNKHMHNLRYLDLAYETLPEEIYNGQVFNNIRIHYKKEIKLGETINCKYSFMNNKHIIGIYNDNNTILHSIIELE